MECTEQECMGDTNCNISNSNMKNINNNPATVTNYHTILYVLRLYQSTIPVSQSFKTIIMLQYIQYIHSNSIFCYSNIIMLTVAVIDTQRDSDNCFLIQYTKILSILFVFYFNKQIFFVLFGMKVETRKEKLM